MNLWHRIQELIREGFAKEDDVRLNRCIARGTTKDDLVTDRLLHGLVASLFLAIGACSSSVGAMALDDTVHIHTCLFLKVVDILRHALPHDALIL